MSDVYKDGDNALRDNQRYSFEDWKMAIKSGGVGVQDGNPSQRWAYRDGYFVELKELAMAGSDSPREMTRRFNMNLTSNHRGRVIIEGETKIRIGGE